MISLRLLPPLTRLVGAKVIAVDMDRAPLKAVLERAIAQNGKFRTAMTDQAGTLSHEYSCLVNGERYNVADLAEIEVKDGDEIMILLPIAGG